jgi:arginine decarboxylase
MNWSLDRARATYNITHWSGGYFDINEAGHLTVSPRRNAAKAVIDVYNLAHEIRDFGLAWPVLVRFTDILHDRVDTLCSAFATAMHSEGYQGGYTGVYPIKVNQQRTVVEQIRNHGGERIGLEAGSKPELMAVLGMSHPGCVIICNGYKDREYIRLALIGRKLGHQTYIVVEKLSELNLVLEESGNLGIDPLLGIRVRLSSIGAGKWQNSGGEKAKFGLTVSQLLEAVERLRDKDYLDCLQLIHFHLGSQLANIRDIQKGIREAARYYAELYRLGANVQVVDVGGGLGVDYEGSRSRSFCSMNYSVQEYANNIVSTLKEICDEQTLPHPMIISESGRALTAHHAMLITNVIDIDTVPTGDHLTQPHNNEPAVIQNLWHLLQHVDARATLEAYHDAVHWLGEAQEMYTHGVISLEQRALAEQFYFAVCWKVRGLLNPGIRAQREALDELNEKLADKYFCNFSLFQSLPDIWAIDQIFPLMPLHRLDEAPQRRVVIEDLTCDSDGRIDNYIDSEGIESTLPLHELNKDEPYLIGMMLVGAYQEILGDMHNLFGDTDSVDVELTDDGSYRLVRPEHGDKVDELLSYVHFEPQELLTAYKQKIEAANLDADEAKQYFEELSAGLSGYTYLEE